MNDREVRKVKVARLIRSGRLAEATALLRRTPASGRRPAPTPPPAPPGDRHQMARTNRIPGGSGGERVREQPRRSDGVRIVEPLDSSSTGPAGRFLDATHSRAGGERRYQVYVPSGYTGSPLPLVVMLHGGTQSAEEFAEGTGMNTLAERHTFLVAYPEQPGSANQMKFWNWFQPVHQRRGGGEPALIAGITRDVIRAYSADPDQVYVAGFSAGGAMAAVMAATYPDVYAAVGVHSGLAYGSAHDVGSAFAVMKGGSSRDIRLPGDAIPLIVFHGDRDQTVDTVNAGQLVDQWRSTDGSSDAGAPTVHQARVPDGHSYSRLVYPNARGDVAMEQWTIHGGGHAWSGGVPDGTYTDPRGPDASAEMVRFFQQHRR